MTPSKAANAALPKPCDDKELEHGLMLAVSNAVTELGSRLVNHLSGTSITNIVLQITEGSDVLDKLLERHKQQWLAEVAKEIDAAWNKTVGDPSTPYARGAFDALDALKSRLMEKP